MPRKAKPLVAGGPETGAVFGGMDGRYRYLLWRTWEVDTGVVLFVMLNPSTADAMKNDPTIRRCIGMAKEWGFGGLVVVNLFAWRATDPKALHRAAKRGEDVVGPDNDMHIRDAVMGVDDVIFAWGASLAGNKDLLVRIDAVWRIVNRHGKGNAPRCLGITKSGNPAHPLFISADAVSSMRIWKRH